MHAQNLTDGLLDRKIRSILLAGRAWLSPLHFEWYLWRYARGFAAWVRFGGSDNDDGLSIHVCIPFVISLYAGFDGWPKCCEHKSGIAIHNGAFWLYPLTDEVESRYDYPWWKKCHSYYFPWTLDWHKTEILTHDGQRTVWAETVRDRKRDSYDVRKAAELSVSRTYPYTYQLKSGSVQEALATVHVDRMEWRARWWPLIPRKQVRNSINISFSSEVGEGTGSWKGGTIGCGYTLLPGETAEQCLRRMESDRKFGR